MVALVLVVPAVISADAQNGRAPDGTCAVDADRFVNCGNGTVTDTVTGLIWLQQADCLMGETATGAAAVASSLGDGQCGLTDGSSPGEWRLPARAEWLATVAPTLERGCQAVLVGLLPSMTGRTWQECFAELEQLPDDGGAYFPSAFSPVYLANDAPGQPPTVATLFFLGTGDYNFIGSFGQGFELRVWPVRDAHR
jgi:hypothetical protein